jgi:hypothetical protein
MCGQISTEHSVTGVPMRVLKVSVRRLVSHCRALSCMSEHMAVMSIGGGWRCRCETQRVKRGERFANRSEGLGVQLDLAVFVVFSVLQSSGLRVVNASRSESLETSAPNGSDPRCGRRVTSVISAVREGVSP